MLSVAAARAFAHGLDAPARACPLVQDGAEAELCDLFGGRDVYDGRAERLMQAEPSTAELHLADLFGEFDEESGKQQSQVASSGWSPQRVPPRPPLGWGPGPGG